MFVLPNICKGFHIDTCNIVRASRVAGGGCFSTRDVNLLEFLVHLYHSMFLEGLDGDSTGHLASSFSVHNSRLTPKSSINPFHSKKEERRVLPRFLTTCSNIPPQSTPRTNQIFMLYHAYS